MQAIRMRSRAECQCNPGTQPEEKGGRLTREGGEEEEEEEEEKEMQCCYQQRVGKEEVSNM